MPTTAERPREALCCVTGDRFPGESLLGEAVGVKKTEVEELVGDSTEVSKLDGAVGSTAFDRSGLPFVVE